MGSQRVGHDWVTFTFSLVAQMVKESACNAGDQGSIPELRRFPREENDNPLQYSCLENSMDRGASKLQSMGLQWVRQNWATSTFTLYLLLHTFHFICIYFFLLKKCILLLIIYLNRDILKGSNLCFSSFLAFT